MSSTRRAEPNAPLSQERYMSSPEFAGLRGISGTATSSRCALLKSPAKRELLWFIQGLSLSDGGLEQLAVELADMFPERIVPVPSRWLFGSDDAAAEFGVRDRMLSREDCREFALGGYASELGTISQVGDREMCLEEFLVDLCINPRVIIDMPGEQNGAAGVEEERATLRRFPAVSEREFRGASLEYFKDVIGALVEYKRRYEEQARSKFCQTAISREIWKQLDDALKSRTMVVIDGREGRGKTEPVRAWCNRHLGVARFLSLTGTNTKTAHFREFARALGVGHGNSHKVSQMQTSVEEVLRTSHLMLVIDEAHFFFNQAPRMKTRPEMLDYIDTAICNLSLPVALVTTPQFMICMERAAGQVGWNYGQFKRRCKRYCRLPDKNTKEDVEAVARHLLPGADRVTIDEVVGSAALSKRDLSAVGDAVRESKRLAEEEGAKKVTFEHVYRAFHEVLLVSDVPWREMEKRLCDKPRRKALPAAPALAMETAQESSRAAKRENHPGLLPVADNASRMRFQEADPALTGEADETILAPV